MRHHVDLGVHGIGAPDHHEVGDAHLARIDAGDLAGADGKSDAGDIGADRRVIAGIFLHMGKAIDAIAHHQPHGAGIVIGPDRLGAEFALCRIEAVGDLVQRFVPRNPRELAGALGSGAALRIDQSIRMMDALGIARHLGADHAGGIGLQFGAAHPADAGAIDHLDIEGTGRRAVVRTGGMPDVDSWLLVHAPIATIKTRCSRVPLFGRDQRNPRASHALPTEVSPAIGVDGLGVDVAPCRARSGHRALHRESVVDSSLPLRLDLDNTEQYRDRGG